MLIYIENAINLPGVFTYSYLLVLCGISLIVYFNNREKTYLYYALYTWVLSVYIFTKASMPDEIGKLYYNGVHYVFNYFIQIIFHCFYILFGINFLNIPDHFPCLAKQVYIYLVLLFSFSLMYYFLVLNGYFSVNQYAFYFQVVFIPIHLVVSFYLIFKVRKAHNRRYLLAGTLAFILFGIIATVESNKIVSKTPDDLQPITYFFIGVVIESTAFALGLGLRIRDVYQEKLNVQKELSDAQVKLNREISEKLKHQETVFEAMARQNRVKELENNLYKLQNKVLRSQMNSHFLFNVLNSIKAFVIENNTTEAVSYLNKFAKFIRKILDGSMHETTSLAEELDILKLYLEIENMRLSNTLHICFKAEEDLNLHQVRIPSFLLQPFVENAVWHGLAESDTEKHLEITASAMEGGVRISITDNGISYGNSLKKKQNAGRHKSHGLKLITERVRQFNESHTTHIDFQITDREDSIRGTQVTVTILTRCL